MSRWWEKIRAEPWVSALVGVLGLLLVTFLAVLFCDRAEKSIVQLLGIEASKTRVPKKHEALKFLGIGMGGVLLALQALIANKRAKAMEKSAEAQATAANAQAAAAKAQAAATKEQAQANKNTEQGQRQERLKNAIEHLGHQSASVRLGGAYELFHLARDTEEDEKELRQTVLDILCAHIRQTTGEPKYIEKEKHQSKPSEEIQSLLTLLFVQKHEVFIGLNINLQGSWLNGSDLNHARLEKAVLGGAQLHGAFLTGARLHGAFLVGAQLHEAHLEEAQLHGADLERAKLHGAFLMGAQLHGAFLMGARMHNAALMDAQLHGANLGNAQLYGASLMDARLYGASLGNARLHDATLRDAHVHGASSLLKDFPESFETSINSRIDKETDLYGAILCGGLTQEDIDSIGQQGLSDEAANRQRESMKKHFVKVQRVSPESLEIWGAIVGKYTKEEADQWIAEYEAAMSGGES